MDLGEENEALKADNEHLNAEKVRLDAQVRAASAPLAATFPPLSKILNVWCFDSAPRAFLDPPTVGHLRQKAARSQGGSS